MAEEKGRLLLVDDETRILSALRRTLRREGYSIETAESPSAALALLEARSVDLVVSDYRMPGGSGADLLRQVRARWPATRRMLLSGWVREIPEAELAAARPHALHAKPWDDAELKAVIRRLLVDAKGAGPDAPH